PQGCRVVNPLLGGGVVWAPGARAGGEWIADVEQDRSVARVRQQRVTKLAIGDGRVELLLRAATEVDLERVEAPGGELVGVLLVVPIASLRRSAEPVGAGMGVDAREQALRMDVVG